MITHILFMIFLLNNVFYVQGKNNFSLDTIGQYSEKFELISKETVQTNKTIELVDENKIDNKSSNKSFFLGFSLVFVPTFLYGMWHIFFKNNHENAVCETKISIELPSVSTEVVNAPLVLKEKELSTIVAAVTIPAVVVASTVVNAGIVMDSLPLTIEMVEQIADPLVAVIPVPELVEIVNVQPEVVVIARLRLAIEERIKEIVVAIKELGEVYVPSVVAIKNFFNAYPEQRIAMREKILYQASLDDDLSYLDDYSLEQLQLELDEVLIVEEMKRTFYEVLKTVEQDFLDDAITDYVPYEGNEYQAILIDVTRLGDEAMPAFLQCIAKIYNTALSLTLTELSDQQLFDLLSIVQQHVEQAIIDADYQASYTENALNIDCSSLINMVL